MEHINILSLLHLTHGILKLSSDFSHLCFILTDNYAYEVS